MNLKPIGALVAAALLTAPAAFAQDSRDLLTLVASKPQFSTLAKAIEVAGLKEVLADTSGEFTVFAPTNDAFAKLPAGQLDELLKPENKDKLVDVLKHHLVAGDRTAEQLPRKRELRSVQGADIKLQFVNGNLRADGARVGRDFAASNGTVFAVDSVMLPN